MASDRNEYATTSFSPPASEHVMSVKPQGEILNDNGINVDHLGRVIYANALADQLQKIKTPITIGIFARWGSGKSFLLKQMQSILLSKRLQRERMEGTKKTACYAASQVFYTILFLAFVVPAIVLFVISSLLNLATIFTLFAFLLLFLCFAGENDNIISTSAGWCRFSQVLAYAFFTKLPIRASQTAAIQSTPPKKFDLFLSKDHQSESKEENIRNEELKEKKRKRRFIFVNYNAWQYAGCDTLWAGIVTTLADRVEKEFGVYTTRIFRSMKLHAIEKPHPTVVFVKMNNDNQKTVKKLMESYGRVASFNMLKEWKGKVDRRLKSETSKEDYCRVEFENSIAAKQVYHDLKLEGKKVVLSGEYSPAQSPLESEGKNDGFRKHLIKYPRIERILFSVGFLIVFATTMAFLSILAKEFIRPEGDKDKDIVATVLSVLPGGIMIILLFLKSCFALYKSQKDRIVDALQGSKKNLANELGFMNKIKQEVQAIVDLIHTVQLTYNIVYKVVITIDDLDRVPLAKVKSVLEAANILLSERMSPFICLIAIDSRVAINCFELKEEENDVPIVNGHEYLKKIINLPFCLPEIGGETKPQYIAGLIKEADDAEESLQQIQEHFQENKGRKKSTLPHSKGRKKSTLPHSKDSTDACPYDLDDDTSKPPPKRDPINFESFLFTCRHLMYKDTNLIRHMAGNPRNIKRMFNVVSITATVIKLMQERESTNSNEPEMFTARNVGPEMFTALDGAALTTARSSGARKSEIEPSIVDQYKKMKEKEFAKDILYWILLTDQWPFRMSYILCVIEDADQRVAGKRIDEKIDDDATLFEIYNKYLRLKEKSELNQHERLLCLDGDPDVLYSLLKVSRGFMTKGKAKELLRYCINLDSNLKKSIAQQRDKLDKEASDDKSSSAVPSDASENDEDRFRLPLSSIEETDSIVEEHASQSYSQLPPPLQLQKNWKLKPC